MANSSIKAIWLAAPSPHRAPPCSHTHSPSQHPLRPLARTSPAALARRALAHSLLINLAHDAINRLLARLAVAVAQRVG